MAINNPYIPGDPYSYDLKWLVRKVKEHSALLENIESTLDQKIAEAIMRYLDQHDPVYYQTAQELIDSQMRAGSIAYIEGYYTAGDGGANLYYVTDDYNDIIGLDFFLTLGANLWAIPVILTPYVTPEMFGADGTHENDEKAFQIILDNYPHVPAYIGKEYRIEQKLTGTDVTFIGLAGNKITHPMIDVFEFTGTPNIKGVNFEGDPVVSTSDNGLHIVAVINGSDAVIEDCSFTNVDAESAIFFHNSPKCTAKGNTIDTYMFIGILIENSSDHAIITENRIYDCTNTTQGYGIQSNCLIAGTYSNGVVISDNIIEGVGAWDGILVHGGQDIVISGNVLRGCRTAIDASAIYKNATSIQKNVVISGNSMTSTTDSGYSSGNPNSGIIAGFDNSSMSENISIVNNTITGFGPLTTGSNDAGILVQQCKGFNVAGNVMTDCKRGIKFRASSDYLIGGSVSGNTTINMTANPVYFLQGVFIDIAITGNSFYYDKGTALTGFSFDNNSRFIKCYEKNNIWAGYLNYISSSSLRTAFHMEYTQAITTGQLYSAYDPGDSFRIVNPSTYEKYICTTGGINTSTAWAANTPVTRYSWITNSGNAYLVTKSGTTGGSAPGTGNGFITDGTAELVYVGTNAPVWKNCGAIV